MMSLFRTVVFALIIIAGLYLVFGRQPAPQTLISLDDAIKNVAATIHNIEKEYPSSDRGNLAVEEISVRFAVHATTDDAGNVQLKVSNHAAGTSNGILASSGPADSSAGGAFGNIITITFKQANVVSAAPQQAAGTSPVAAAHQETARNIPPGEARRSRTHGMTATVIRITPATGIPKPFAMQQE